MSKSEHNLAASYFKGSDLESREQEILQKVEATVGFKPTKLLGKSRWWGSKEIGAFQYLGQYKGKDALLKVQGVKPDISEAHSLVEFGSNKSRLVRPPKLYALMPWSDKERFEALIIELIDAPKLISLPTKEDEVRKFIKIYKDYRKNCLRNPWLPKPKTSLSESTAQDFKDWSKVAKKQYPDSPFRKAEDTRILKRGLKILVDNYKNEDWEFQHTHISTDDIFKDGRKFILTSNLLWAWRGPFFDLVFAYHWYPYILGSKYKDAVTPELIEQQKKIWLKEIWKMPKSDQEKHQLKLALLERQLAGLTIDAFTVNRESPVAEYLVESTRKEVVQLIESLD